MENFRQIDTKQIEILMSQYFVDYKRKWMCFILILEN